VQTQCLRQCSISSAEKENLSGATISLSRKPTGQVDIGAFNKPLFLQVSDGSDSQAIKIKMDSIFFVQMDS
jgi:hypothetical protein